MNGFASVVYMSFTTIVVCFKLATDVPIHFNKTIKQILISHGFKIKIIVNLLNGPIAQHFLNAGS